MASHSQCIIKSGLSRKIVGSFPVLPKQTTTGCIDVSAVAYFVVRGCNVSQFFSMVSTLDYAFQVQWLPLIEETMEEMEALTRNLSYRGHNITVENIEIHHVRNENCRIFIAAVGLLLAVLLVLLISSIIQLRNNNVSFFLLE